jgi:Undecaprenyl-phosphate glucose phosphotransferase
MNVQDSGLDASRLARLEAVHFPYSPAIIPGALQIVELLLIVLSGLSTFWFLAPPVEDGLDRYVVCGIFVAFGYVALSDRYGLNELRAIMRPLARADDVIIAIGTVFMLLLSLIFGLRLQDTLSVSWIMAFGGVSIMTVLTGRQAMYALLRWLSRRRLIGRSLVVLGAGEQARRFLRRLNASEAYFTAVAGVFDLHGASASSLEGHPVLGDLQALLDCAKRSKIDDVVVALPWAADREVVEAIEKLKELPINVHLSTDLVGFELTFRPVLGDLSVLPLFEVAQRPISGWSSAMKAVEDKVLSLALVILVSPLLLAIAVAIRLDTPGPILFRQKRLGFNNQTFEIYKFRSMHHCPVGETVVRQASRGDPRVTRVGRFIRATSLDELPQLFNVLNGTMSLVGPRPHAMSHNEEYGRQIRGYFARHRVLPGITGWAQVNGLRGETETLDKMEARIRHDIYYAENWSLLLDLKILFMTGFVFLFQRSAY